jgi:phosphoribosylamine-glycine ligase
LKIAIASGFACALSWWARLQDEGHDVAVWIEPQSHKSVGEGLVPKMTRGEFDAFKGDLVLFDSSGLGDLADAVRKRGLPVVGGGAFMDRLEKDRSFGQKIAEEAGCTLPPFEEFESFTAALERARELGDLAIFFKSDRYLDSDATHGADSGAEMVEYLEGLIDRYGGHGRCIIQQKIDGVPLSTARWWNGMDWVGPYEATYENKKFMNDDVGPSTGCSFNVVWFYDGLPAVAKGIGWEQLTPAFRKHSAPPGLYDINVIVAEDGTVYFLEWTPRLGYDSEMTSALLLPDLGRHLAAVATGHDVPDPSDDMAYAVRLSIPPYPWEHGKKQDKGGCDGIVLRGHDGLWDGGFVAYCVRESKKFKGALEVAGPEGIVGLAAAVGADLEDLHEDAIDVAKALRIPGLSYRTDGAKDIQDQAAKLAEAGFEVHPGML